MFESALSWGVLSFISYGIAWMGKGRGHDLTNYRNTNDIPHVAVVKPRSNRFEIMGSITRE